VSWRHGRWTAEHALPVGVTERAPVDTNVSAGDVIAVGVTLGTALRVAGARRLGLAPSDLERQLRVRVGTDVLRGTVLARVGRAFPRSVTSPIDGRLLHVTVDGDLYVAPTVDRWVVRSTLDGPVIRSDDAVVAVEGSAWCIEGAAAYGPDATGELTLAVDTSMGDIPATRLDVRLGGRILIGGARVSADVMTRAHACGVAGLVAGAAPAAGLRVVYGDTVTASGTPSQDDRPTMLCLMGFGTSVLPAEVWGPLIALAGSRAAIHTASARLFVFASPDASELASGSPNVALAGDYGSVRGVDECADAGEEEFASELRSPAVRCGTELLPSANVRRSDAAR
jgi:hypothetical protein